ncbi:MAG: hypothetical protein ACK5WG_09610, partial [Betaproteobacteria bacterium]
MSPPGRPKDESLSAQREGSPMSPPGRPKGESPSAPREDSPMFPPGRPKGESPSAPREDRPMVPPGLPNGNAPSAPRAAGERGPLPWSWLLAHVIGGYARQHPLRVAVQVLAIAIGVALGYAVHL